MDKQQSVASHNFLLVALNVTCDEGAHSSSQEDASCTCVQEDHRHGMVGACCSCAWVVSRPSQVVTCVTYGQVADSSCLEGSCGTCVEEHVMSVLVAGSSSLEESCEKHDLVV